MAQPSGVGNVASAIGRRQVAEFALLAGSTVLFQGSRLGVGFIAAAVLTPAQYGAWGLVLALLSYGVYANLGILSGANREIPRLLGSGAASEAKRVEDAAFGATLVASAFILILGLPAVFAIPGRGVDVRVLAVTAVALQQLYLFYQTSLRSRLEFNRASLQQALLAAAFPLASVPILWLIGVAALVVGQGVAFATGAVLVWAAWRRRLRPSFDAAAIRHLVAVGMPIMVAGVVYAILTTADRWLTLWLLGDAALGAYTLATLISSALLLLALVVAQQLYPRMAMRFGANGTAAAVWPMARQQGVLVLALLLPAVVLIVALTPLAITTWLPSYREAIPAVMMLPFGFLILAAGSGFMNLLVTVGRSGTYLVCLLIGLIVEVLAAALLAPNGIGLTGIALAASSGFAAATATSAAAAFWVSHRGAL